MYRCIQRYWCRGNYEYTPLFYYFFQDTPAILYEQATQVAYADIYLSNLLFLLDILCSGFVASMFFLHTVLVGGLGY